MTMQGKREQWAERIAAWERSGLSRRVWCAEHGVNVHTLDYWRRQLGGRRQGPRPRKAGAALVPVMVAPLPSPAPAPAPGLTVRLPNGLVLQVPLAADAARVAQWVQSLQAC